MSESIQRALAQEAVEAEERAESEERGEIEPTRGHRGRKRATDPSQVYAVRIPVSRLRRLREIADEVNVPPTTLIRQWVLERLDDFDMVNQESTGEAPRTELNLGPKRRPAVHRDHEHAEVRVRRHA